MPPSSAASTASCRRRSKARNRTVRRVKGVGRRLWKKESECHRQGRVLSSFFRYKTIIGGLLRARSWPAQQAEAAVACNVLNRMREHGWPAPEKAPR